ncbi:MAG: TonB family protein [Pseudomonadota bacterium]|nr:MAG: TonB family protein [Pseudomonadota bacterium]
MSELVLEWLARASLLVTLLVPMAWACSALLRRFVGARAGYAAWILVLPALTPRLSFLTGLAPFPGAGLIGSARLETFRVGVNSSAAAWPSGLVLTVWLAGAFGLALWAVMRQRRFESILDSGAGIPGRVDDERRRLARQGLPAWVGLRLSGTVPGAMIVGAFPPRLYLPADGRVPDEVIAHEIAHIRHGDPFWRVLASALRCTFWFLPWVHFAWTELTRAQELAADEAVIARLDRKQKRHYAGLLAGACGVRGSGSGSALGWSNRSLVKERIKMMAMKPCFPRSLRASLVLVVVATVSVTVAVATAGAANPDRQAGPNQAREHYDRSSGQLSPEAAEAEAKLLAMQQRDPLEGDRLVPVVRIQPRYPRQAAEDGVTGHVTMEARLTEHGQVIDIEVLESEPAGVFDAEAVQAFSQWRFVPVSPDESGPPEPVRIRQVIEFVLD